MAHSKELIEIFRTMLGFINNIKLDHEINLKQKHNPPTPAHIEPFLSHKVLREK